MRAANQELADFNAYSDEQHARLAGRFVAHVATLQSVHTDLLGIFKRVRALRGKLLHQHPDLAQTLKRHESERDAHLELARGQEANCQPPHRTTAVAEATRAVSTVMATMEAGQRGQEQRASTTAAGPCRLSFTLRDGPAVSIRCDIIAIADDVETPAPRDVRDWRVMSQNPFSASDQ